MPRSGFLLIVLAAALPAVPEANAQQMRALFGDGSQRGCYIRAYDTAHFARHPKQRVRVIAFDYEPSTSADSRKSFGPLQFGVAVRFRDKADGDGGAVAYCRESGRRIACSAEADAGTFEVAPAGRDMVKLTMTRGLGFENNSRKGYVSLEDGPDDKVFVLRRAPIKACDILS